MNCVAIIIAGGKGTRLSKLTTEIPKPMIPIGGKPVLEHQIDTLVKNGIRKVYITVGYLKEAIMNYFGDGGSFGCSIEYLVEETSLGTCGIFYLLKDRITTPAIIVYGDVLFNIDMERLLHFHNRHNAIVTLTAHPNSHPYDSDLVVCNEDEKVLCFDKKEDAHKRKYYHNLVNAGLFYVENSLFDLFSKAEKRDFEKDLLAALVLDEQVYAYRTSEYIKDMGTYQRLEEVERYFRAGQLEKRNLRNQQKCIFLDRDGTLNKLNGFVYKETQLELEESVAQAVRLWNENDYLCIVITNQPVIARNLCTIDELEQIHMKLETLLGLEGAYIDDLYYCPHHPDAGYPEERKEFKIECNCRKPGIAMIEQAITRYNIDIKSSYFIGDSTVDIQTGKNAGLRTVLVRTGEKGADGKYEVTPDLICQNLLQAAEVITNETYE